jgi:hypothetical protein
MFMAEDDSYPSNDLIFYFPTIFVYKKEIIFLNALPPDKTPSSYVEWR